MTYNFDTCPDRRSTESIKWRRYDEDVLPMWVADMDFVSAPAIVDALRSRVEHGVFGYPSTPPEFFELLVERMAQRYQWEIKTEDIVLIPGVVTGFNLACHAFAQPGEGVFMQTPVYFPFFGAPKHANLEMQTMQLTREGDGSYSIDFDAFEAGLTDSTRLFILCNPHNPVGRVFRKDELERMAEICLRHNVLICSDEIHCDLVFEGHPHIPIASLSPEIAQRSMTLMAPSKTFNIAGLECSLAIIQNPELRQQYQAADKGLVGWVNLMGQVAAHAAYRHGQPWLDEALVYLQGNRDYLVDFVRREMPEIHMASPEGTYLAWLDCREANLPLSPSEFFLQKARVGLNEGATFGPGGEGFVRLNFACPRTTLQEGLRRMKAALDEHRASR